MVVSPRQPGSALKPFLYGLAFDRGYTPATVLPDVPRTFTTADRAVLARRTTTASSAARSGCARRSPAPTTSPRWSWPNAWARARCSPRCTTPASHRSTRSADHYGLGLALGNGDVTLLELANGYRGIANGGVWRPVRWYLDETTTRMAGAGATVRFAAHGAHTQNGGDAPGAAIGAHEAAAGEGRRFMSAGAAALVLDILSDPVARIPGFGIESALDLPFPAAAKTGTSRHFTDNWAVATTASFTVAVWVGNFSGRPMQGVSGITGAGPLLQRAALLTARRYPPGSLPTPDMAGAVPVQVCLLSGLRATPECPSMTEWFLPGTEPTREDDWQRGGRTVLPPEYAEWAAQRADAEIAAATSADDRPEAGPDDVGYRILSPLDGDVYERPVGVDPRYATIPLAAAGADGSVRWFVDGRPITGTRWQLEPGTHVIRAEWPNGRADSVRITVR